MSFAGLLLCFGLGMFVSTQAAALTVYRIGGPAPDATAREDVDLVHLSWLEAANGYGGLTQMVELEEQRLGPVFLEPDRNYALDAPALGGGPFGISQSFSTLDVHRLAVDGDPNTAFGTKDITSNIDQAVIALDLGGLVPVDRVVFYPTPANQNLLLLRYRLYFVRTEDLAAIPRIPLPPNSIPYYRDVLTSFELFVENAENRSPRVEITMPTQQVRAVLLDVGDPALFPLEQQPWEVAELEIYGEGFVSNASYDSRILDLGAVAILGRVSWRGRKDCDAKVSIRTRTGQDDDPVRYLRHTGLGDESFFDASGRELTREVFGALSLSEQAGTADDPDNWSFWSTPYAFGDSIGTSFASPGPARFVQLQAVFENTLSAGGELSFLEFEVTSPPVVRQVVGEVSPRVAVAGAETEFVYALRPSFSLAPSNAPLESGFDRLTLVTPGELVGVDSVRVNQERVPCELVVDATTLPCRDYRSGSRFEISLPRMGVNDTGKIVELFFRARVFRFGTVFDAQVFDSTRPGEAGQVIVGGDATFRLDSNQLSVGVDLSGLLLQDVGVSSPAITPNGDGVNDVVSFDYTLLQLATAQSVNVDVFDLSGRRVRRVYEGAEASGRHGHSWDGRGDGGSLPPGVYLYRIRVDTDDRAEERGGLISIVY